MKDVIRVFARVRRAMPATLVMVGDGPERPDAEAEVKELGVAEDVKFLGRLDSVAMLLQGCELFLLPSTTESFGLAALEAMACGAVVVATRVGGIPRWSMMAWMASSSRWGRWRRWGAARWTCSVTPRRWRACAAAIAAREFSADRIVPMYEELYAEVVR